MEGRFKINVDAAFNTLRSSCCLCAVVRDSEGSVLAAAMFPIAPPSMAEEAEAMAVFRGLSFALEMGFFNCIIETDCLLVVRYVEGKSCSLGNVGLIIKDVLDLISRCISFSISHVGRIGNKPAHILAKDGLDLGDNVYWVEECPICIWNAVLADLSMNE